MKRKILIISILTIILIIIISVIVYIQVQSKTKEVATLDNNISTEEETEETKDENLVTNEEVLENTEDNNEEITNENEVIETKEETTQVAQETKEESYTKVTNKNTNEKTNVETPKTNNQSSTSSGNNKPQETTEEETKQEEPVEEVKKVDLSKYSRYESALNGGYKAYMKSDSEMTKLRNLIDTCIKEFGYTNVKVVPSSSIVGSTQSFTANKTNVENKVYNSEYFTIYYYAEAEYHITANGDETIFQYRSYIKVQ